jgi:hypothetical protein
MNPTLSRDWEQRFQELKKFRKKFGHCDVPSVWPHNPKLAKWVKVQRNYHSSLPLEKLERLYNLGFAFDRPTQLWLDRFFELVDFKKKHGHCHVPCRWRKNPQLGEWVSEQRKKHRKRIIALERQQRLENVGFVWDAVDEHWHNLFKRLMAFKKYHGHCNVPRGYPKDRSLARWVVRQRQEKHLLRPSHIRALDQVEFDWQRFETEWKTQFEALQAYKKKYGHCCVPCYWNRNRRLGGWVSKQRRDLKKNVLSPKRKRLLDDLGFHWQPHQAKWNQRYQELVSFKSKFGHTRVPRSWPRNPSLGSWVSHMRESKAKLANDRYGKLERLGLFRTRNTRTS